MSARRLARRLSLGRFAAVPAGSGSLTELEACVRGAADYFRRTGRREEPARVAGDRLAEALADGKRRLFVLRPEEGVGEPSGLLELALDSPHRGEVTLVLLLLSRGLRRRGLGGEIARALFPRLAQAGFSRLHLGVAEGESGAAAFWESLGMWPSGRSGGVRLYELPLR